MDRPFFVDRPRIFCIGLNKTGTVSFDAAMTVLGFRCLHDGGATVSNAIQRAIDDDAPLLSNVDPQFDAFSDIGLLSRRYARLDTEYPGSRFVLTTRPVAEWVRSRRRHVERNRQNKMAGVYTGEFLTVDEAAWREEWVQHGDAVRRYFAGPTDVGMRYRTRRTRFLEIDLTTDATWAPLCTFLGVAEPDASFPWLNRATSPSLQAPVGRTEPR